MKAPFLNSTKHRVKLWLLLCFFLITVSFITRILLFLKSYPQIDITFLNITGAIVIGLLFDVFNAIYFSVPFVLYLWLTPDKVFNKTWHRYVLLTLSFLLTTVLIFNGVAEWLFWD